MASIQKRGKKYAVVYTYDDSKGEKKQKWETFITKKEALKRKAAVENEINNGTFIPPEAAENASNRNSIQTCTDRLCYAMHH